MVSFKSKMLMGIRGFRGILVLQMASIKENQVSAFIVKTDRYSHLIRDI
jgi:hypothetical protein